MALNLDKQVKPKLRDLEKLVGNPDVYALQDEDGEWHPRRKPLDAAVLRLHRAGELTVGTYIVRPPDEARTLVFDFDDKGDNDTTVELQVVTDIIDELGIDYAVEDSGGEGQRYHVWVVAEEYMPAEVLYRLGRGVRDEAELPQLEVFPKQRQVKDLGNLIKLPGGVHGVTGRNNNFLGWVPELNPVDRLEEAAEKYPEARVRSATSDRGVTWPCVHKIQEGVEEGGRNIALFHFAVMARQMSLDDENVELVVRNTNARFRPPLDDDEVEALLESSKNSGPIHGQLQGEYCDENCLPRSRQPGLYTRSGAIKWAEDGQLVVLAVADRTDEGRTVELEHPDIVQGRALLVEKRSKGRKKGKRR